MPIKSRQDEIARAFGVSTREERRALDELYSLVYEELRRLASFVRKNEISATLNSTALVHEAWLRLKDSPLAFKSGPHFKSIAAIAMRRVLVDEARRRTAQKRDGSETTFFALADSSNGIGSCAADVLALDAALDELKLLNPRQAEMVEGRFFSGLTVAETAELLGVSESVVERDWRAAKAWLSGKIRPDKK